MSSPAGLHLQDLILDTKATATKEQKAEAVSEHVVVGTAPSAARDSKISRVESHVRLDAVIGMAGCRLPVVEDQRR